ncbi:MAG: hypothetical protein CMQ34_10565 [Gammaproteobacteria bacterium]|nr:hypothetical protein [Gammaproteobacteria bacterium]|tara:strand:- start:2235 stop:2897 length:663 start_codon:yes stop_codon:yes gene_type:complete
MSNEAQDRSDKDDFELGVGNALSRGWVEMKGNFLVFLLAVLVLSVFMTPMNMSGDGHSDSSALIGLLETAYLFLLYPIINYGADLIFLRGVRGDQVEVKSIFDGFQNYVNIILASLLTIGLISIGLIVFIFPGIYVACRLAFVSYLVMDEGLDPIAAVEASWRITRGHAWRIFVLGLSSVFIFILGLIILVVGVFPALIWIKSAFAALYLAVTQEGTITD